MKRVRTLSILVLLILAMIAPMTMAAKPSGTGFDEFGYNYQARVFVGPADGVDRTLDGKVNGDPKYANDHLVMKWSKGWDDARFHGGEYGPDAWETNEWNGMVPGGSGEVWHYKIIWVGPELEDSLYWREGGYSIWGQFEVIMSQGTAKGEHIWDTLATPAGFGGPAELWMYKPRVKSNIAYNTYDPETLYYRLIIDVRVGGVEDYNKIKYVKVTYPDETTVEFLMDEGSGWGWHEANDGEYFAVVNVDEPITGDFTFEVSYKGNTAQITANLDEWLPAFDEVSPSWNEVVDISETSLILDWEYSDQYSLRPFTLRLGYEGTGGGTYFWHDFAAQPPYTYGYLAPGDYWHGIFAETTEGNSIHAFTNFEIIP